jgi:uncharacterized protein YndB with AHSA1/START domain
MKEQITMTSEIHIARPAEEVWAVLADYDRDTEWRGGVTTMRAEPPGPAATGTRTVEVMRFAGRTLHNDGLVTDTGPGLRFTWRTTSGVAAEGLREVTATGDGGCRVRVEQRVRPTGFDRVVAGPVQWILQRRLDADVRRLAALVGP